MRPLTFEYKKAMLALMCVGFPLLLAMCVLLPIGLIYSAHRFLQSSVKIQFDSVLMVFVWLAFIWVLVSVARIWRSFFTVYVVDQSGINARFFSSTTFLDWERLSSVTYRRAFGQIEMRFEGHSQLVVLNNVDMNPQRKTVYAALQLIEKISKVPVRRSRY